MKDPWVLTLYAYLLVLLVVPVLVRWRWGLRASLIVTVAELGLVALVFCLLEAYRVFPDPFAGEPTPRAPMEIMRRGRERHVVAFVQLAAWAIMPATAALIGGALSLVWSGVAAARRALANRS